MKKLLIIGLVLSGVSCSQAYASLDIREFNNGTGFEVVLKPIYANNSGVFTDVKNNHAMDAITVTIVQPDTQKRTIELSAIDSADNEEVKVDFTINMGDKTWCQSGDLMLTIVNGLFLQREYANDSAVRFKMLSAGANLGVFFDEKNLNKHAKYVAWYNKFSRALQLLLRELGVKLMFNDLSMAAQPKVMPQAPQKPKVTATVTGPGGTMQTFGSQKGVDQAAINVYANKEYSSKDLQDILTKLGSNYPIAARTGNEERARAMDALKYGSSEFKAKSMAGKNDDALKAVETGYYFAKTNELNLKKFTADPLYTANMDIVQKGLQNYLSTPVGDGRYFADIIRDFENQWQSQPSSAPAVMEQQLTPEQKRQQQRETAQRRMQERAAARQERRQSQMIPNK